MVGGDVESVEGVFEVFVRGCGGVGWRKRRGGKG